MYCTSRICSDTIDDYFLYNCNFRIKTTQLVITLPFPYLYSHSLIIHYPHPNGHPPVHIHIPILADLALSGSLTYVHR